MRYEVADWDNKYENAETRKRKSLFWVLVPNCHDGLGYCTIMEREDALEVFGAWVLILQVASKSSHRGSLSSSKGRPYSAKEIATMTRAPVEKIRDALDVLVEIGWVLATAPEDDSGVVATHTGAPGGGGLSPGTKKEKKKDKIERNPIAPSVAGREGESGIIIPSPLCDDAIFMDAWDQWCKHQEQMHNRRFTLVAQEEQLKQLATMGAVDATTSLVDAMVKTWQGPAQINNRAKSKEPKKKDKAPARSVADSTGVDEAIKAMKGAAK